jgi:TonB-linked SusC/RagA family outer membrane protein
MAKPARKAICGRSAPGSNRYITKTLLVMRLTIVFLTAACLGVSASGISQTVSFSGRNVPLIRVFAEVKKQTGYVILYTENTLEDTRPVSIQMTNVPLEEFLQKLLADQPVKYSIDYKTILLSRKPPAVAGSSDGQPSNETFHTPNDILIDIKGRIVNEAGEPVVATILVKGGSKATTSDEKGAFVLTGIEQGAVLVISGVSIETKEIKVSGKADLSITVKTKVAEGQEVMVTAYGIEKRTKELGYSAVKVSGEELNRANPSDLLTGLIGKVSGLNLSTTGAGINPQIRVLLRGIRSFGESTNNVPLFILNGAPFSFGADQQSANVMLEFINNINPNDIESINILKGANGAALYGPEGVNGVIIITTKKGKTKAQINFRHSSMFQSLDTRYPKLQTQFGSGSSEDQFGQGIYDPHGSTGSWGSAFTGEMVQIGRPDENGVVQMVPYKYTKERFKFYNIAQTIQNTVSVSQGDSHSDFYLSAGNTYASSLTPGDISNRYSLLLNAGRQFGILNTRINIGYTNSHSDVTPGQPDVLELPAHIPLTSYKDFRNYKWADHNHYWADDESNPYEDLAINRSREDKNAFFGGLTLTVQPVKWLKVTNRTGINYYETVEKITGEPIIYSQFGKTNGRNVSAGGDRRASVSDNQTVYSTLSNDLLLNGQFTMGVFSLKTTLGNSIRNNLTERIRDAASSLLVPIYNIIYNSYPATVDQLRVLSRSYSFFGTGTLGYKDWAFLELTGRQDWDSKIAAVARSKNFYYGANTSIVLGEAIPSLVKNKVLSGLRVRASVVRTANMNIEPYQAESILNLGQVYANVLSYDFDGTSFPNPLLKPENVISQEYGMAATFLKERIQLDVTYYRQRNNGVIAQREISPWSGASQTTDNIGDFLNHGWEFDIKLNPLFKLPGGLSASVDGMFSINDNKVLSLGEVQDRIPIGSLGVYTGAGNYVIKEGLPAYTYNVSDWKRDDRGRVVVDKVTGLPAIDASSYKLGGRSLPMYMGSFNFHLLWKNMGLHVVGEYRGGYNHYFRNGNVSVINGTAEATAQYGRRRFVFPNSVYDDGSGKYVPNTDIAVKSGGAYFYNLYAEAETNFLVSGAFWKLRELAFSYDLKIKTNWIKQLTVTLAARNLFTIYPKTNRWGDPELTTGAGTVVRDDQKAASNVNGIFGESPIGGSRLFGLSLNANF